MRTIPARTRLRATFVAVAIAAVTGTTLALQPRLRHAEHEHVPVQGRQLGRPARQLRRRPGRPVRPVAHRHVRPDVCQGDPGDRGVPRQPRCQHGAVAHQPVHGERQLLEVLPRSDRRGDGAGVQGHRLVLGGDGRQQGRLHRRPRHVLAHVEHRGEGVPAQPARLLRADERAARLHRHRVGRPRRQVAGHLLQGAAQPRLRQRRRPTTTTSPRSAPTRA